MKGIYHGYMTSYATFTNTHPPLKSISAMVNKFEFKPVQQQEQLMLYIPDVMKDWPWPRQINPLYEEISATSKAWIYTFGDFVTNPRWRKMIEDLDGGMSCCSRYPLV